MHGAVTGAGSQGNMVSDYLVPLRGPPSSEVDGGMERPESGHHGHCWVPGCSVYIPGRKPRAPRTSQILQLVSEDKYKVKDKVKDEDKERQE